MKFLKNISLAPFTTFGIGGPADYFFIAKSSQDIIDAIAWTHSEGKNMPFFILGTGANILIADKGVRGLVIKNESKKYKIRVKGKGESIRQAQDKRGESEENKLLYPIPYTLDADLTAESGITIAELIEISLKEGLSGLEHFAGIPSTLGGALWQNLHFLSPDRKKTVFIGDIVENAEIFRVKGKGESIRQAQDKRGESEENKLLYPIPYTLDAEIVSNDYFRFSYDYSILRDTKDIVLSAVLKLKKEDKNIIHDRINANLAWRREKHPENAVKTSAGSIFKKISEHGAGRLIEKVGLKGYKIGGARVSEKHANFIVNTGNATAKNVRDLIMLIQQRVKDQLGLKLEPEISFVGEF